MAQVTYDVGFAGSSRFTVLLAGGGVRVTRFELETERSFAIT